MKKLCLAVMAVLAICLLAGCRAQETTLQKNTLTLINASAGTYTYGYNDDVYIWEESGHWALIYKNDQPVGKFAAKSGTVTTADGREFDLELDRQGNITQVSQQVGIQILTSDYTNAEILARVHTLSLTAAQGRSVRTGITMAILLAVGALVLVFFGKIKSLADKYVGFGNSVWMPAVIGGVGVLLILIPTATMVFTGFNFR